MSDKRKPTLIIERLRDWSWGAFLNKTDASCIALGTTEEEARVNGERVLAQREVTADKFAAIERCIGFVEANNRSLTREGAPSSVLQETSEAARAELAAAREREANLLEACKLLCEWIGPPPSGPYDYDSLREDGWKKAQEAIGKVKV